LRAGKLTKQKKFGLVFEEHLPECTPLYDVGISRDSKVASKTGQVSDIYIVRSIDGDKAICEHKTDHAEVEFALGDLVAVAEFGEPIYPYLKPIDTVCNAPDSDPWHTLIEADNYHALQLLEYLYAGKVDCIYIDPPYNTGHDFIYDDDFAQTHEEYDSQSGEYDGEGGRLVANPDSNGRFHSDWCSMMYPRLLLARDFLSDDGVIFISIDDNEQVNLRRICDEIFGESSMVTDGSAIICDFFSGSATTAHAVIQQNLEDGGYRKFLLVQLPESCSNDASAQKNGFSTICDIGEERIRRAGKKIVEEVEVANAQLKLGEDPKPVPDIGFRVFSIDSSNFLDTYSEPGEQTQASLLSLVDNLKEDRTPEDLLFQVLPAFRIPYSAHVEKMDIASAACFNVNDGQLIACFDTEVSTAAIEKIAQLKPIYAVFRDASFASDSDAANFEELFKTYSPDTVRRVI